MSKYAIEYEHLKLEAETSKKYVFERPILILTVCIAVINLGKPNQLPFIPSFITFLLCFNLLFTVNRLFSAARIIAYIKIIIEKNYVPYVGWENYLDYHREFKSKYSKKELSQIISRNIDKSMIPKGYGFYPIIYYFHLFVLFIAYGGVVLAKPTYSPLAIILSIFSILLFLLILIKYRNSRLKTNLPFEKILANYILKYIKEKRNDFP